MRLRDPAGPHLLFDILAAIVKLKADHTVIVLLGSFNPRLFHPFWMQQNGVLTSTEAEGALGPKEATDSGNRSEVQPLSVVVTEEIAQVNVPGLQITVESSRLTITGLTQERHERTFEIAVALQKLLPHSPTHSIGLNRNLVLEIESVDAWHRIGHAILPKNDFWKANGEEPGTTSAAVRYNKCAVEQAQLNVVVGPVLDRAEPLVRVSCNYHFGGAALKLATEKDPETGSRAIRLADFDSVLSESRWDAMRNDAFQIAERVHALGKG